MLIPASELERDKRRARILAEERGDIPQREYQDDQDIPKPNRWHRSKTAYLPRMNYAADYDPSRPNDYTQFKAQVQEWRMQRGLYDESESDHDDRPHNPRFAPPTSYAPVAGPYSLMEVVAPSTPTPTAPPPPSAALPPGPPPVPPPSLQARTAKVEPKPSAPAFVRASDHLDTPPSPLPISQAQVDSDPSTFAERLMAKYGYKEGEGLGAEGNKGIVTPLQASHIPAKGKRRRGAIINENVDAEQEYTKSRYGNPSEVIVLTSFSTAQATEEELRQAICTYVCHAYYQPQNASTMDLCKGFNYTRWRTSNACKLLFYSQVWQVPTEQSELWMGMYLSGNKKINDTAGRTETNTYVAAIILRVLSMPAT